MFSAAPLICDNVLSRHTNRGSTDGSVMLGGTDKVKFLNMNWEEKLEIRVRYLAFMNTAMNIRLPLNLTVSYLLIKCQHLIYEVLTAALHNI